MANQSLITVFDGATTPVSHALEPVSSARDPKNGALVATWREQLASLPREAQVSVVITVKEHPSKVIETRTRVNVPVQEVVTGSNANGYSAAPKVAFVDSAELVTYAHPRSTQTSRGIAMQMLRNLMTNTSTTVTPVSAGVVHDASVKQIYPN